jgi:hypothetical protein
LTVSSLLGCIASREILSGGVFLAIFPRENFFGLQEDLSTPRVFPLKTINRMAPIDVKSKSL